MARKLTFQKWNPRTHCESCGRPWVEHPGIAPTCRTLQNARLAAFAAVTENRRLKKHLSGAMAFRLLVYLSVLPAGAPHTVKNLLGALAKIRRKNCGEKKPIRRSKK
jgi:hypothetical protein